MDTISMIVNAESNLKMPQTPAHLLFDKLVDLRYRLYQAFVFSYADDSECRTEQAYARVDAFTSYQIPSLVAVQMSVPSSGFQTARLTATPSDRNTLPLVTFEYGTIAGADTESQFFFYVDFVPRVDAIANPDYLDQPLYDWLDRQRITLDSSVEMKRFVSSERYIRLFMSPCSIVYTCEPSLANAELIASLSDEAMTLWLGELKALSLSDSTQIPNAVTRSRVSQRDSIALRHAVLKDPGSVFARRLFGEEAVRQLQCAASPLI